MKGTISLLFMVILLFSSCIAPVGSENSVMFSYWPIQCESHAWEAQWYADNDSSWAAWHDMNDAEKAAVLKDYIEQELNVTVFEIEHYPMPPDLCVAAVCGNIQGDHYEILVSESDLELMQFNGFWLVEEEE